MATIPGGIFDSGTSNFVKLDNFLTPIHIDLTSTSVLGGASANTIIGGGMGDTIITGGTLGNFRANAGNDMIDASGSATLDGSAGASTIVGGAGNDYIISGGPNGNANTFVFRENSGKDVIENFNLEKDVVLIRKVEGIDSVKDLLKNASQDGENVIIKLGGGNKITLLKIDLDDLKKNANDHFQVY